MKAIEEIKHTADLAIRVRGQDLTELFANAARGMFGLMSDLQEITCEVEHTVSLEEGDQETLLVSWLSELLWLNEEQEVIFKRFELQTLTATHLQAVARGGAGRLQRHIKAVTFHDLEIVETETGYQVTLVFDV